MLYNALFNFNQSKCGNVSSLSNCFNCFDLQVVYVMPSTSGRTQTYPRASDKLPFFLELKTLRDEMKRETAVSSSCDNGLLNTEETNN